MLTKQFEFELKSLGDAGTFEGYASVYGNVDSAGDIVERGAFTKSLSVNPSVPILYQHNQREPIGLGRLEDTASGLKVYGDLVLDVPEAKSAYALMRKGVLKGLSIGYTIPKGGEKFDTSRNVNVLHDISLHEVSVVTFPANSQAQITGVKNVGEIKTIRDFEDYLRDSGFSRTQAAAIASHGWKAIQRDADEHAATAEPDANVIAALLAARTNQLRRLTWN